MSDSKHHFLKAYLKEYYYLLFFLFIPFILHAPIWLGFIDFYSGDGSDFPYIYSLKVFTFKVFQGWGEIPLWNPYLLFGQPIVGNVQYALFYPLNVIFLFIPFIKAIWIFQTIHLVIAGIGSYLLAKHIGCGRNGSLISGCLYMLNGRVLYYINAGWLGYFSSICWLPLLLLCSLLILKRDDWKFPVLLACIFAMTFLAGTPQYALLWIYLFIVHVIAYLFFICPKNERLSLAVRVLVSGLLSLLLISIQLFPAIEQSYLSSRMLDRNVIQGFHFQWNLRQWFRLLFRPEFLKHDFAWEMSAYIGIGGILLAGLGLINLLKSKIYIFLIVIWGVIPWAFSLGASFSLANGIMKIMPGMPLLTNPSRYFIFSILVLCLAAGYGLEYLLRNEKHSFMKAGSFLIIACLCILIINFILTPYDKNLALILIRFFIFLLTFMLSILLIVWKKNRLFIDLLIFWLIIDPLLVSTGLLQEGYLCEDFNPPEKIIRALKQYPNQVRIASIQPTELRNNLLNPIDDWLCIKYGIERAGGYEPLCMRSTLQFLTKMDGTGKISETMWGFRLWGFSRPDFYNLAGVTHLISPVPINSAYLSLITQDSVTMPHFHGGWWRDKPLYLYKNQNVLPRAFILNQERNGYISPVLIMTTSPNHMSLFVSTEKQGVVVISESFHPGWIAVTGDKQIELKPFMNTFISFIIPPGEHKINLEFRPESFFYGHRLTLLGLALVIFLLTYKKIYNLIKRKIL